MAVKSRASRRALSVKRSALVATANKRGRRSARDADGLPMPRKLNRRGRPPGSKGKARGAPPTGSSSSIGCAPIESGDEHEDVPGRKNLGAEDAASEAPEVDDDLAASQASQGDLPAPKQHGLQGLMRSDSGHGSQESAAVGEEGAGRAAGERGSSGSEAHEFAEEHGGESGEQGAVDCGGLEKSATEGARCAAQALGERSLSRSAADTLKVSRERRGLERADRLEARS